MKRKLHVLWMVLAVGFLFAACEKDEDSKQYNTIKGQLTANENMTTADFGELGVNLVKLHDNINPDLVTTKTEDFDIIETVAVKQDGSFAFDSLVNGNYIVALTEGFIFPIDTFVVLPVFGGTTININKPADRVPDENGEKSYLVKYSNNTEYNVTKIMFYYGNNHYKTITASDFNTGQFSILLDKKNNVSFNIEYIKDEKTLYSKHLKFFGILETFDCLQIIGKKRWVVRKGGFWGPHIKVSFEQIAGHVG